MATIYKVCKIEKLKIYILTHSVCLNWQFITHSVCLNWQFFHLKELNECLSLVGVNLIVLIMFARKLGVITEQ